MNGLQYIDKLSEKGAYHFTFDEAKKFMDKSPLATRRVLERLQNKKLLARPYRHFYLIIPPEYRVLECLPAAQFIHPLMQHLKIDYYVALLSAAQLYGASHQQVQVFQVITEKTLRPIHCGKVRIQFIKNKDLSKLSTKKLSTPRGYYKVSRPEVTIYDLIGNIQLSGGINNVITVINDLLDEINADALLQTAQHYPISYSQRLGYLLEFLERSSFSDGIYTHIKSKRTNTIPLSTQHIVDITCEKNSKWKLKINTQVEIDG